MNPKSAMMFHRAQDIAPIVTIALLLVLPALFAHDPQAVPVSGPEQKLVADAVEAMPYRIGSWAGRDAVVPEAAVRLLRPNAMISRRFTNLERGLTIDFTIVHCGDARDMLGHYPPVCYPSAGWVADDSFNATSSSRAAPAGDTSIASLVVAGQTVDVHHYRFSRIRDYGETVRVQIFNFFVLPSGQITYDIGDVSRRTNWLGASVHGVAQVQLLMSASVPLDAAIEGANEILQGMTEIFESLGVQTNVVDGDTKDVSNHG
jgi:hypothetical protein